jgi:threonine/homoserine/homoserine lactone efflux protein
MPPEDFWNIAGGAGKIGQGSLGVVALAASDNEHAEKLKKFINKQSGDLNSALIKMANEAQDYLANLGGIVYRYGGLFMVTSTLVSFIAISMLLTIAPGPDILYVITQGITQGKKAGIATALGLSTGLVVHTTAAAIGVSTILQQSVTAFTILKYAGAIYLFFLAWKALLEKNALMSDMVIKKKSKTSLYKQGILMNILNPKVGLFFIAFLPQFVNFEAGNVPGQMILLGVIFMLQTILIFCTVAILAGNLGKKLFDRPGIVKYVNYVKASILALIGLKLVFTDR